MRAAKHAALGSFVGGAIGFAAFAATETVVADPWIVEMLEFEPKGLLLLGIYVGCGVFFGSGCAALPDSFEPSRKYGANHRGFFHSWIVLLALSSVAYMLLSARWSLSHSVMWMIVLPGIGGYISHLLADLRTPRRLPLLARRTRSK